MKSFPWKTILIALVVVAAVERIPALSKIVKGA